MAPTDAQGNYENLTNDELHPPCSQRVYTREDPKAALKTRLKRMGARDTSASVDTPDESLEVREKRSRAGALHSDFASDKEVAKGLALRRDSGMKGKWNSSDASVLEGVGATIFDWTAGHCDKSLDQKLLPEEEREHRNKVRAGRARELSAWIKFEVFSPTKNERPQKLQRILDGCLKGKSWMETVFGGERFPGP